jgi:hypothetical protein
MKKHCLFILTMLSVFFVSTTFVACGDDDDASNPLVGFWEGDHSEGYWEDWTFKSDGTGERHTDDGTVGSYKSFTYTVLSQEEGTSEYYGKTISGKVSIVYTSGSQSTISYYIYSKYMDLNGYSLYKR